MNAWERKSAERARSRAERGTLSPREFRASLLGVTPSERDAWLDLVLGLGDLADDGPELPRGCVPYLPCPVDALLRLVDQAPVRASDVFVDVGSGAGRAVGVVHLLTGAPAIGIEIQRHLASAARNLATRLRGSRIATVEGDATNLAGSVATGSIFFFYCPFSGPRLASALGGLEPIARTRMLRLCTVDLPLPRLPWLAAEPQASGDLGLYRTILHDLS